MPSNAFANRADPDQEPDQCLLCLLLKYDTSNPTKVDLTSNLLVLCIE